jgi:mRNA interferase RelE/StbE
MNVEVSDQVWRFLRVLAPAPRKQLRDALRGLARGRGEIRGLEADLAGFYRLRVGRYRVIFTYSAKEKERVVRCEFTEERSIIYQLYAEMVKQLQP